MMRTAFVAAMLLVTGCRTPKTSGPAAATPNLPKVDVASVLAADDGKPPPLLVVIDAPTVPAPNENILDMPVKIAAAASWADLAKQVPATSPKPASLDLADKIAREAEVLGQSPDQAIKRWNEGSADAPLVAAQPPEPTTQDDPPPPPPDDDGEDESGGTGTQIALDEGRMGNDHPKHPDAPASLAGRGPQIHMPAGPLQQEDGTPMRLADVAGEVIADGKLGPHDVAILATPRTNAQRLAQVLAIVEGELVVASGTTVRPLRLDFARGRDSTLPDADEHWIEVRATHKGLVVEAVPETPIEVADAHQLGPAIEKARAERKLPATAPVDVLVEPDADTQHLVDLLATLDTAGVRLIGIGAAPAPDSDEAKRRGHRIPTFHLGRPMAQGDLSKKLIRDGIAAARPQLFACYTAALAKQPDLTGTVQTQFFIAPTGKVTALAASGVDPAVSTCIGDAIKKLEFPKPAGGGGVQVYFPFSMRP